MAIKYYQTFDVQFVGQFPVDMLRYDSAFPASEQDSGKIIDNIANHERGQTIRVGRFVETKKTMPTIERWASFGARISNIEVR